MLLLQLPDELLLKILSSSTNAKTFGRLRRSCRKLNRIAHSLDTWADEKWGGVYLVDNDPTFTRLLHTPSGPFCISVTVDDRIGGFLMAVVSSTDKTEFYYIGRCEGFYGERLQLFEAGNKMYLKFEKMPRVATGKRYHYRVNIE